jgi:Autophagy-related protein 27
MTPGPSQGNHELDLTRLFDSSPVDVGHQCPIDLVSYSSVTTSSIVLSPHQPCMLAPFTMHYPLPTRPARLVSWATFISLATAATFNCDDVVAGSHLFNLKPLGGHHSVSHVTESTPNILNTTYTLDICSALGRDRNIGNDEQCPEGTRSMSES